MLYPVTFWDEFYEDEYQDYLDTQAALKAKTRSTRVINDDYLDFDVTDNLCCDLPDSRCDCLPKDVVEWEEVYNLDLAKSYDGEWNGLCSECLHYQMPTCVPLRTWVRTWITEGKEIGRINMCKAYDPVPTAQEQIPGISTGEILVPLGPAEEKWKFDPLKGEFFD